MNSVSFNTAASNKRISELLTKLQDGSLIPRPDFQRRIVWSTADKNEFLRTVLKSYPFPEIYTAVIEADISTAKTTDALVDGQQRITTLLQYFTGSNALGLEKDIKPYSQLSDTEKRSFLNYQVAVRDLGIVDIEIVRDVFMRINRTSYALNKMERQNAEYQGELKKLAERISASNFFSRYKVFSDREIRRMSDVVFSLTLIITMMSTYFHREVEISSYLEKYNDNLPNQEELVKRFSNVVKYINSLKLAKSSRAWKKADLFVLFIEIDRLVNIESIKLDITKVRTLLADFYKSVDLEMRTSSGDQSLQKYFKSTVQATADRTNRVNRAEVIRGVLKQAII